MTPERGSGATRVEGNKNCHAGLQAAEGYLRSRASYDSKATCQLLFEEFPLAKLFRDGGAELRAHSPDVVADHAQLAPGGRTRIVVRVGVNRP